MFLSWVTDICARPWALSTMSIVIDKTVTTNSLKPTAIQAWQAISPKDFCDEFIRWPDHNRTTTWRLWREILRRRLFLKVFPPCDRPLLDVSHHRAFTSPLRPHRTTCISLPANTFALRSFTISPSTSEVFFAAPTGAGLSKTVA